MWNLCPSESEGLLEVNSHREEPRQERWSRVWLGGTMEKGQPPNFLERRQELLPGALPPALQSARLRVSGWAAWVPRPRSRVAPRLSHPGTRASGPHLHRRGALGALWACAQRRGEMGFPAPKSRPDIFWLVVTFACLPGWSVQIRMRSLVCLAKRDIQVFSSRTPLPFWPTARGWSRDLC